MELKYSQPNLERKLDNIAKLNLNDHQYIKIYVRYDHDLLTSIKCNVINYQ